MPFKVETEWNVVFHLDLPQKLVILVNTLWYALLLAHRYVRDYSPLFCFLDRKRSSRLSISVLPTSIRQTLLPALETGQLLLVNVVRDQNVGLVLKLTLLHGIHACITMLLVVSSVTNIAAVDGQL